MNYWKQFLAEAVEVLITKDTDYESAFMKALIKFNSERGEEAARTIWAWEVEKKLNRCRTWIKRGELRVKNEGVRDSVIDLFIYTMQYQVFLVSLIDNSDPFYHLANLKYMTPNGADYWIDYLVTQGLIQREERELQSLLLEQMTGLPF